MVQDLKVALVKARDEIDNQFHTGLANLRNVQKSKWLMLFLALWCLGILGDAHSTWYIITHSNGAIVEGNPAAVGLMSHVGLVGWAIIASIFCAVLMVFAFGKVTGMYSRAVFWTTSGIMAGKVFFALSNYALWFSYLSHR